MHLEHRLARILHLSLVLIHLLFYLFINYATNNVFIGFMLKLSALTTNRLPALIFFITWLPLLFWYFHLTMALIIKTSSSVRKSVYELYGFKCLNVMMRCQLYLDHNRINIIKGLS